ncbi:MAG: ATP-grasp domain-containing protein [Chitinophagaceae bacterium]|nr:ATP-grasp domain-containing protein [Chitinophagaceae bacterium]MCW5928618.1 ATP-grasp domain-containing protein [Chitinophagaceae bacterium]
MNILITSAGQRVSLVRAFKKELKETFADAKVFTTDMYPELSAACNVSDGFFKVKPVTHNGYINDLINLCKTHAVKMIVPTIDTELLVLAKNKSLFDEQGIHVIISGKSLIKKCRDKREINKFFLNHEIEIPQQYTKDQLKFPLFIKPYDGSLSVDTYIIYKEEELTEYHLSNEKFMFMEYIDKDEYDEFTVDMYYGKDNFVKCIVPRKRILVRSGEINKGITKKNVIVSVLKEHLNKIDGAIGCLTLQLFLHQNQKYIKGIEINPRFGGGFPLSYLAGANFPLWLIKEYFLGEKIAYTENWEEDLLMLRYDDEILVHNYND